jgi:adenylate kinase
VSQNCNYVRALGKVIVISGTPGVGKTSVALRVAELLDLKYVNLSDLAVEKGFILYKDSERDTFVVDEDNIRKALRKLSSSSNKGILVDSHYGEIVDDEITDKVIVLRLNPLLLLDRLRKRGYPRKKIKENAEAELLGTCTYNALASHPADKVCEVDVTGKSEEEVADEVIKVIKGVSECRVWIDWLSNEDVDVLIQEISKDP